MRRAFLTAAGMLWTLGACTSTPPDGAQSAAAPTAVSACQRTVNYGTGAFALGDLKAKLTFDKGYRIVAIDALALDSDVLHRAGDEIAIRDAFQANLCWMVATGNSRDKAADWKRVQEDRAAVACLMKAVQSHGASLRGQDVDACLHGAN